MTCDGGIPHFSNQVARLIGMSDLSFGLYALRRSGLHVREISDPESFIQECWQDAHRVYSVFSGQQQEIDPIPMLADRGVGIVDEFAGELDRHYIHLAVYDPGRHRIELSRSAIQQVEYDIVRYGLAPLLGEPNVERVVLLHEAFHVLQNNRMDTFQDQRRRRVGKSRLCEELAAVRFSRLASGLSYSPEVFQVILVHSVDAVRANKMIQDILEK